MSSPATASRFAHLPLMLLAVLGAWLGFPNPLLHLPPAVLLFPACLTLLAARASAPGRAFRLGFLTGGAAFAACLYWLALPVHDYAYLPWILAVPCPILLGLALGLYTGLYVWVLSLTHRRLPWLLQALLAGLLWGALEWVRGWLFTGFPWLGLASAFAYQPMNVQAVALIGAYGLAAWLALGAALPVLAPRGGLVLGLLVLVSVPLYGHFALSRPLPPDAMAMVGLVQGNIDQGAKWDEAFQQATVERYVNLSSALLVEQRPVRLDLLVWPETAMPFFFQEDREHTRTVLRLVRDMRTPLIIGAPGYERTSPRDHVLFNRAYLADESGKVTGVYEKEHLVPFGEYVPFSEYLPFLNKIVPGMGDFMQGRHTAPLPSGRLNLGLLICYEAIFPELARDRVAEGANLLVNISNDAWYGRSSAAAQHLALSMLRAVEQGRSLVRATNTGISAIVDPRGKILASAGLFETASLATEVGLYSHKTPFYGLQPYVGLGLSGAAAVLLLLGLAMQRSAPKGAGTIQ